MKSYIPAATAKASPSSGQNKPATSLGEIPNKARDLVIGKKLSNSNSREDISEKSEELKGPNDLNSDILVPPITPSNPGDSNQTPNKPPQQFESRLLRASSQMMD